jgi:hypothetical protein
MRSTTKTTLVGLAAVGILGGTGIAMPSLASADQARPQHQTAVRTVDDHGRDGRHHDNGDDHGHDGRHHDNGDDHGHDGPGHH